MAEQGLHSIAAKKYKHHASHGTIPNGKVNILKSKEHTGKGIGSQMISQTDHSGKSFDLYAKICRPAGKIDVFRSLYDQIQHEDCKILRISANCESCA